MFSPGGRALDGLGALPATKPNQTPNAGTLSGVVGLRVMRSVVERETAQTIG
jgi:hypothetical protein